METSQPLTSESFSYSWLTNKRPSFRYISDDDEEAYFIVKSRRFLEEFDTFNFDFPVSNSLDNAFVHADEIFVNGHIMPSYFDTTTSASTTPIPNTFSSKTIYFVPNKRKYFWFFGKWKRSSKRVLFKCFKFLVPRKLSIRVDDIDRKVWEVKNLSHSVQSSPLRNINTCSSDLGDGSSKMKAAKAWGISPKESPLQVLSSSYSSMDASCDRESSVHEAVLHCKRSFEK